MPHHFHDVDLAAKMIVAHVGKQVIISVPLGLGKPVGLLNALYRLALNDASIQLTILTGLTLARPLLKNELEKRFITPILERLLKDYEDPLYELARQKQTLPKNIEVIEFFLTPGNYLNNAYVQQHYISSTYTNVVRDGFRLPINVHAQLVASHPDFLHQYSLSCNSDLFLEAKEQLQSYEQKGRKIAIVAEINQHLPFMYGDAIVDENSFSFVIHRDHSPALFALPREALSIQDHLIGLYTSTLVKDDGCLQIGIGKLSNAVANALILRHKNNHDYCELLNELGAFDKFNEAIQTVGALEPFSTGLYASTEMLSDEYIQLYRATILKKKVYDHIGLQELINKKEINDIITPDTLDSLIANKLINLQLTTQDIDFLKTFGIFRQDVKFHENKLILPSGEEIPADLSSQSIKIKIGRTCLGKQLLKGKIIHAGFFIGSLEFYSQLQHLTDDELKKINMTTISRTNQLSWSPHLLKLQRQHARFINSSLMLTLEGQIISDSLKDYIEFSGVGGQFDFVYMANELPDARLIINCRSTRLTKRGIVSNIVWNYPTITVPRFFRDIIVTEYGIADCRSKIDADVIKAILNVTDSRFQNELLATAKAAGKIEKDYKIPNLYRNNFPEKHKPVIEKAQARGYCLPYPFGSDLEPHEAYLAKILSQLKYMTKIKLLTCLLVSCFYFKKDVRISIYLERMNLQQPKNLKEYFYKNLLTYLIRKQLKKDKPH